MPAGRSSWAEQGAVGTVPALRATECGKLGVTVSLVAGDGFAEDFAVGFGPFRAKLLASTAARMRVDSEPALEDGFIDRAVAGQLLKKFNY
jgi:hypothetical protein